MNIIGMIDRMKSDNHYYLVLDFCNGGDLSQYLRLVKHVDENVARIIISQLVDGMTHFANLNALHRDLKDANIFLHFPNRDASIKDITPKWLKEVVLMKEKVIMKIGDLGFSKLLKDKDDFSNTYCGTPLNMAPELLNGSTYNQKADVWSIGTIMFEILIGFNPFRSARDKEDLKKKVNKQDF